MPESRSRRPSLLIMGIAVLFVVMPFLFWQQTWFGRRLSNQDLEKYLNDPRSSRHVQHAIVQLSERMAAGDPSARQWYPGLIRAAGNPNVEIRTTAAWAMGQDNTSEELHGRLTALLHDPDLMVRRNAALSLVRFRDAAGRDELVRILRPYPLQAPRGGVVQLAVKAGQDVGAGTPVTSVDGQVVTSPMHGRVETIRASNGARIDAGATVVELAPRTEEVWEALRALYLIGRPEDLPEVERYSRATADLPDRIRRQAALTAQAIQARPH